MWINLSVATLRTSKKHKHAIKGTQIGFRSFSFE